MTSNIDPTVLSLFGIGSSSLGSLSSGPGSLGLGTSGLPSVTQYQIYQQDYQQQLQASNSSPQVQQAVSYFEANIGSVKSVSDLFNNYQLSQFVLGAANLSDQSNAVALVQTALTQDPSKQSSLVNQLSDTRFKQASAQLQLYNGLGYIQSQAGIQALVKAYQANNFTTSIATDNPAVAEAIAFKSIASGAKNAYDVLGNRVIRDVVQTAYSIPAQIAYQPVEDQAALINRTFNVANLQNPTFVNNLINQYLVQYDIQNSSTGSQLPAGFSSGSSGG